MSLTDIAKIYTDLVKLDDQIPAEELHAKDQLGALRTKYHEMLMAKMKEEGIPFSDRFDAMNKAFEFARQVPGTQ